jgi:hypothetical protein
MLKLEFVVHDQQWPQLTLTITRESFAQGRIVQQEKKQYDLALGKAEEMVQNHLRFVINEIIARHKPRVGAGSGSSSDRQ